MATHPPRATEKQLLAALGALRIEVPDDLGRSTHDPELRTASLWALLWRAAGASYEAAAADPNHARRYFTGPWEWPLPEAQAPRARFELDFARDRLQSISMTVPPWSVGMPHDEAPNDPEAAIDGWAHTASCAVDLALTLLGPLCHMSSEYAHHHITQADITLRQLCKLLEDLGDVTGHPRCDTCGSLQHTPATGPECPDCPVPQPNAVTST
ncbi:hypothetical protein [Kitasatospora sp. NPDC018614]|uniref:hypothetical protein n=1 Tax=Kitasatospora sp. NPDC018614 TaxID=3364026 RepID=UPI0037B10E21